MARAADLIQGAVFYLVGGSLQHERNAKSLRDALTRPVTIIGPKMLRRVQSFPAYGRSLCFAGSREGWLVSYESQTRDWAVAINGPANKGGDPLGYHSDQKIKTERDAAVRALVIPNWFVIDGGTGLRTRTEIEERIAEIESADAAYKAREAQRKANRAAIAGIIAEHDGTINAINAKLPNGVEVSIDTSTWSMEHKLQIIANTPEAARLLMSLLGAGVDRVL